MDDDVKRKLEDFFYRFRKVTFDLRQIIIEPEEEPAGVFYIEEGTVRMYAISSSGEELNINMFKRGAFFPMAWVLNNTLSHYYFEAVSPVTVWKAPKDDFLEFLKDEPDVVLDLLKRIYKGLDGYFTRMEYLMSGNAMTRLITEIIISAKRFGETSEDGLVLKLTEKELASQTGIARETVSRQLSKLKEKGALEFEKSILKIKDLKILEKELGAF